MTAESFESTSRGSSIGSSIDTIHLVNVVFLFDVFFFSLSKWKSKPKSSLCFDSRWSRQWMKGWRKLARWLWSKQHLHTQDTVLPTNRCCAFHPWRMNGALQPTRRWQEWSRPAQRTKKNYHEYRNRLYAVKIAKCMKNEWAYRFMYCSTMHQTLPKCNFLNKIKIYCISIIEM